LQIRAFVRFKVTTLVTNGFVFMAGKVRHLVNRSGRYHARLVVPKDLRDVVGKSELRTPLGGDRSQALKKLPGAVAVLQNQIALAEVKKAGQTGAKGEPRYPLSPNELAQNLYTQRLAQDDELRNHFAWASIGINDLLVHALRNAIAGRATDADLIWTDPNWTATKPCLAASIENPMS
jgi:hypothetical protein